MYNTFTVSEYCAHGCYVLAMLSFKLSSANYQKSDNISDLICFFAYQDGTPDFFNDVYTDFFNLHNRIPY